MQILLKAASWTSLVSVPVCLLIAPNSSALAESIGSCANSLISSGVAKSPAAVACSDALEPDNLAACVNQIQAGTDIQGNEALQACYRVRRPDELASCVTTISTSLEAGSAMALDTCRRSLLPERHAECTLDLVSVVEISSEEAMKSCITAEITPGEVAPETTE
ncbi:MAG: hypothetical protein ACFCU7_16605 [Pleurocapsa sp.]